MKKILLLATVSLLALVLPHSGAAAQVLKPDQPSALPPALRIPEPMAKSCDVCYPVAGDDYVSTAKNTPVMIWPLDNDTDNLQQNFYSYTQPSHGTLELIGWDTLEYTPAANYVGSDSFTYTLLGCLQCSGWGWESWCSEPVYDYGTVYITVTN